MLTTVALALLQDVPTTAHVTITLQQAVMTVHANTKMNVATAAVSHTLVVPTKQLATMIQEQDATTNRANTMTLAATVGAQLTLDVPMKQRATTTHKQVAKMGHAAMRSGTSQRNSDLVRWCGHAINLKATSWPIKRVHKRL
jgi:hypothetical protein